MLRYHNFIQHRIFCVFFLFVFASVCYAGLEDVRINEILASNYHTAYDPDFSEYGDWIELVNMTDEIIDLSGCSLTDDLSQPRKYRFVNGTKIYARQYFVIWTDGRSNRRIGLHTNFKLSADGEAVGLFGPSGETIDAIEFGPLPTDVSYGRIPGSSGRWGYTDIPTPGARNDTPFSTEVLRVPAPEISHASGYYVGAQTIFLNCQTEDAQIRYTLDGSIPTVRSQLYEQPISIQKNTVLRFKAWAGDPLPSTCQTATLFINEHQELPVLSLISQPGNLFDTETGIYVDENIADRKEWKRSALIQMFNEEGQQQFSIDVDIRLFGRTAYVLPQKSLSVFPKEPLSYRLFEDKDVDTFESFLLRSSSDDWHMTMMRDGLMQSLLADHFVIDRQAYQPAALYINAQYYGIHNLREKYNEAYIESYYGVLPDSLDLLFVNFETGYRTVLEGDEDHFTAMENYILTHDMRDSLHLAVAGTLLDLDDLIDYACSQIWCGNHNWSHNVRAWRPRSPDGRWRWLIFDMDRGFVKTYDNTLEGFIGEFPIFEELLKNKTFRQRFLNRFDQHANVAFERGRVLAMIDSLKSNIEGEMPFHAARWIYHCFGDRICGIWSVEFWNYHLDILRAFAYQRGEVIRRMFREYFGLSNDYNLTFRLSDPTGGTILLGPRIQLTSDFSGSFFYRVPLQAEAVPAPGYRFSHWEGPGVPVSGNSINIVKTADRAGQFSVAQRSVSDPIGRSGPDVRTGGKATINQSRPAVRGSVGELTQSVSTGAVLSLIPDADAEYKAVFVLDENNVLPGRIEQDLTLDAAGSPYFVRQTITIPRDITVEIGPGSEIRFSQNSGIQVFGKLRIEGGIGDPVVLRPDEGAGHWNGLIFSNSQGNSLLEHVTLDRGLNAETVSAAGPAIASENSKLTLSSVKFENAGQMLTSKHGDLQMAGCSCSGPAGHDNVIFVFGGTLRIEDCDFVTDGEIDLGALVGGIVSGNRIRLLPTASANEDGIDIYQCQNMLVEGNRLFNCPDKGVSVGAGSSVLIRHTIISGCNIGIALKEQSQAAIQGCTLYRNKTGIVCREDTPGDGGGSARVLNSILCNVSDLTVDAVSDVQVNFCLSDSRIHSGSGNLRAAPLFADPENQDFSLLPGSPCIDAGDPASTPDPDGTRADMGALFFDQSVAVVDSLFINEWMARNNSTLSDAADEFDDWIEIFNAGSEAVNIAGYFLTDNPDNPDKWRVPEKRPTDTIVLPGRHILIWADSDTAQDGLHADFKLSGSGEFIGFSRETNQGFRFIDSLSFGPQQPDISSGRYPDGTANIVFMSTPTPGQANDTTIYERPDYTGIKINEFLALNSTGLTDAFGESDDWIELVNAGNDSIDVGGLYVTDELLSPAKFRIPATHSALTTIAPQEFLILWADAAPEQGATHLSFSLRGEGEFVGLCQIAGSDTAWIDTLTFSSQSADTSFGRYPDGEDSWRIFPAPTPGATNIIPIIPVDTFSVELLINEILTINRNSRPDESGANLPWLEVYNPGADTVDLSEIYIAGGRDPSAVRSLLMGDTIRSELRPDSLIAFRIGSDSSGQSGSSAFQFGETSGAIRLLGIRGQDTLLLDSLTYAGLAPDVSYGRYPDGTDSLILFAQPTFSAGNTTDPPASPVLFLNEIVMEAAISTEEQNLRTGWIEIYNAGEAGFDIGGLELSLYDRVWQVPWTEPEMTRVAADSFLVIWVDGEDEAGVLHTGYLFSAGDQFLELYRQVGAEKTLVDSVSLLSREIPFVVGRYPDGADAWAVLSGASPGLINHPPVISSLETESIPDRFFLYPNYPNPFNPVTTILFDTPVSGKIRLDIVDLNGRLITILADKTFNPGSFQIEWQGEDQHRIPVASGVYLFRMRAPGFYDSRKLLLLK